MVWPFLIALGLLVLALCWRGADLRGQWVAGIFTVAVILMQAGIEPPGRWIYAATLWSFAALCVGFFIGAGRAGLVMVLVPLGYWALAAEDSGLVDLSGLRIEALGVVLTGRDLAFGVTELASVAAVILGGWGGLHVHRRGNQRDLLVDGGALPLVPVAGRTTAHPHARRAEPRRAGRADQGT